MHICHRSCVVNFMLSTVDATLVFVASKIYSYKETAEIPVLCARFAQGLGSAG